MSAAAVALKRFKLGGKFLESHREIFKHYKEPPFVSSLNSDQGQKISDSNVRHALSLNECKWLKKEEYYNVFLLKESTAWICFQCLHSAFLSLSSLFRLILHSQATYFYFFQTQSVELHNFERTAKHHTTEKIERETSSALGGIQTHDHLSKHCPNYGLRCKEKRSNDDLKIMYF